MREKAFEGEFKCLQKDDASIGKSLLFTATLIGSWRYSSRIEKSGILQKLFPYDKTNPVPPLTDDKEHCHHLTEKLAMGEGGPPFGNNSQIILSLFSIQLQLQMFSTSTPQSLGQQVPFSLNSTFMKKALRLCHDSY